MIELLNLRVKANSTHYESLNSIARLIQPLVQHLASNPSEMKIAEHEYSSMLPEQRKLFLEGEALSTSPEKSQ